MSLVPPYIAALRPYEAGLTADDIRSRYNLGRIAKLSSNENPLGVSPLAIEEMRRSLAGINRYNNGGLDLRRKLAERFEVKVENVIAGAGSEGIIADILRTFLSDDDEVLTTEGAFLGFQVLARGRGVPYRTVPMRNWHYDLPAIAEAITERTKLIYLANPNNPTGTIFTRHEFDEFHRRVPERVLIILDEAYFEFAQDTGRYPDSMHYRYDNVITLRTFSKAYGLAAARIGYGFAHEELIGMLLKIKLPFEPSGVAQAAALGALEDRAFLHRTLEANAAGMSYLKEQLVRIGYRPVPSEANFLMLPFKSAELAQQMFQELLEQGVIVRPLKAFGLPECLRISVGTQEENEMCIRAMERVKNYVSSR